MLFVSFGNYSVFRVSFSFLVGTKVSRSMRVGLLRTKTNLTDLPRHELLSRHNKRLMTFYGTGNVCEFYKLTFRLPLVNCVQSSDLTQLGQRKAVKVPHLLLQCIFVTSNFRLLRLCHLQAKNEMAEKGTQSFILNLIVPVFPLLNDSNGSDF